MDKIKTNDQKILLNSICHIRIIKKISSNKSYEEFMNDSYGLDIILMHLIQIGELAGKFTDEFKEKHSNIDFYIVKGMRNVIVHDYNGIRYKDIYLTVKDDLPDLEKKYIEILISDYNIKDDYINKYSEHYSLTRNFNYEDN